jgi:hypothetical protein
MGYFLPINNFLGGDCMLTGKCSEAIIKLLKEGDFNVRVTVANPLSRFTQKSYADGAWKETIRDSIGEGLYCSENYYKVVCTVEDGSFEYHLAGNMIVRECWNHIVNANAVRLDITKMPVKNNSTRTWIIVRP